MERPQEHHHYSQHLPYDQKVRYANCKVLVANVVRWSREEDLRFGQRRKYNCLSGLEDNDTLERDQLEEGLVLLQMLVHPPLECDDRIHRDGGAHTLYDVRCDLAVASTGREWAGPAVQRLYCGESGNSTDRNLEHAYPDDLRSLAAVIGPTYGRTTYAKPAKTSTVSFPLPVVPPPLELVEEERPFQLVWFQCSDVEKE